MAKSENPGTPVTLEARRLLGRIKQKWQKWRGSSNQIYFEDRVDQYRRIWQSIADDLGLDFVKLSDDIWELRAEHNFLRLCQFQLELDNPVTLELAGQKPVVHKLLSAENIAVPPNITFTLNTLDQAEEFLKQHRFGIVIKPASGFAGKGVTTNVANSSDIRSAAVLASIYDDKILAEKHIAGECFRLLVFQGKVISAVRRTGLRITGDGRSTVRQLIAKIPRSGFEQSRHLQREIDMNLGVQKIDAEFVPASMREIVISGISSAVSTTELRTIYDTEVFPEVCPEIIDCAEQAARVLRSDFLGVDIITTDIGKPLGETSGVVNEANTTPALHHHYNSSKDRYPRVAMQIIQRMLALER